jgi:hypothetical protein
MYSKEREEAIAGTASRQPGRRTCRKVKKQVARQADMQESKQMARQADMQERKQADMQSNGDVGYLDSLTGLFFPI